MCIKILHHQVSCDIRPRLYDPGIKKKRLDGYTPLRPCFEDCSGPPSPTSCSYGHRCCKMSVAQIISCIGLENGLYRRNYTYHLYSQLSTTMMDCWVRVWGPEFSSNNSGLSFELWAIRAVTERYMERTEMLEKDKAALDVDSSNAIERLSTCEPSHPHRQARQDHLTNLQTRLSELDKIIDDRKDEGEQINRWLGDYLEKDPPESRQQQRESFEREEVWLREQGRRLRGGGNRRGRKYPVYGQKNERGYKELE